MAFIGPKTQKLKKKRMSIPVAEMISWAGNGKKTKFLESYSNKCFCPSEANIDAEWPTSIYHISATVGSLEASEPILEIR